METGIEVAPFLNGFVCTEKLSRLSSVEKLAFKTIGYIYSQG